MLLPGFDVYLNNAFTISSIDTEGLSFKILMDNNLYVLPLAITMFNHGYYPYLQLLDPNESPHEYELKKSVARPYGSSFLVKFDDEDEVEEFECHLSPNAQLDHSVFLFSTTSRDTLLLDPKFERAIDRDIRFEKMKTKLYPGNVIKGVLVSVLDDIATIQDKLYLTFIKIPVRYVGSD